MSNDERDDLMDYMVGGLLAFSRRGEGDQVLEGTTVVQVVDNTADVIELAFDMPGSSRRYYLKLPAANLCAALQANCGEATP